MGAITGGHVDPGRPPRPARLVSEWTLARTWCCIGNARDVPGTLVSVRKPPDWAALVEAARAGDVVAQGELLTRFDPLARSMARRLVDRGRVDDLVQESYVA